MRSIEMIKQGDKPDSAVLAELAVQLWDGRSIS